MSTSTYFEEESHANHALLFLEPDDVTQARATSNSDPLAVAARGDPLWNALASRCFGLSVEQLMKGASGTESFDSSFKAFVARDMKGWGAAWAGLHRWIQQHIPEIETTFRPGLGSTERVWAAMQESRLEQSLGGLLANPHVLGLWKLVDGQHGSIDRNMQRYFELEQDPPNVIPRFGNGVFGGYTCYDSLVNVCLLPLVSAIKITAKLGTQLGIKNSPRMIFAMNYDIQSAPKFFVVDVIDGSVRTFNVSSNTHWELAVPQSSVPNGLLRWFQEYVRRLADGAYAPGDLHAESGALSRGIRLFPSCGRAFSSCVTQGVECTGSTIYMPEHPQGGWTYSITFRLVGTAAERGFDTCQLFKRKWEITEDGKRPREVEGEGVIGFFPILADGGWLLNQESDPHGQYSIEHGLIRGLFSYQSCSGKLPSMKGSFGGSLEFHPGTRRAPRGPPFHVRLAPFRLDVPDFMY